MRSSFGCFLTVSCQLLGVLLMPYLSHALKSQWNEESLKRKAGQLLWVGYHNSRQISDLKPSGLIFFGWNSSSAADVQKAVKQLRKTEAEYSLPRVITAVDHEGGRVLRLRKGMTFIPDAAALSATRDPELVSRVSYIMGRELRDVGIDVNFAPVLDRGGAQSFLQNRVWGNDPDHVTQMTQAFIEGHLKGGALPFPKHFPGFGPSAHHDAHFLKISNNSSKEHLFRYELPPFLSVMRDGRLPAMMASHVEVPVFDRGPATLSKKVLSNFLRQELGYSGFLLADDLGMGGLQSDSKELPELALRSLKSGIDAVIVVWSLKEQYRVRDRIVSAIKSGELSLEEVDAKIARLERLRKRVVDLRTESRNFPSLSKAEKQSLVEQVWTASQEWVVGNHLKGQELLGARNQESWTVLAPAPVYRDAWKVFRPQDEVFVFDAAKGEYRSVLSVLHQRLIKQRPLVVMSLPLHNDGGQWVKQLVRFFNLTYKAQLDTAPLLWIHMGVMPVRLASRTPNPRKPVAMVLLHSTTSSGLRHFLKVLKSGHSPWSSVSQRSPSSSP